MSYPALQDRAKSSKQFLLDTINSFSNIGGVILGCTELPLIINDGDLICLYSIQQIYTPKL
ncbi:MAG: hypothetical protein K8S16_06795 [Bacteroidales bacterium]|nr:hypothetical protein [Bacteroidales bacterium]